MIEVDDAIMGTLDLDGGVVKIPVDCSGGFYTNCYTTFKSDLYSKTSQAQFAVVFDP
jgi:hypothetical protein